jgi:hypothetical protein
VFTPWINRHRSLKIFGKKKNFRSKPSASVWIETRKRKDFLIKNNISGDIDPTSGNIETLDSFVARTVAKEDTLFGAKSKFALIVRA